MNKKQAERGCALLRRMDRLENEIAHIRNQSEPYFKDVAIPLALFNKMKEEILKHLREELDAAVSELEKL